ncbi:hypothetical protein Syun_019435 [Stephania yunnanensis]|uniref:Uncharacterized protein n=1 Tax=Stephania yunnanensis TaxID=152371 RepID=A0AAP0IVT8_9MAGN
MATKPPFQHSWGLDISEFVTQKNVNFRQESFVIREVEFPKSDTLIWQGSPLIVFSAFGFVHKIATFEKTAGFQALVQFSDLETASAAKNSLDGRSIPRAIGAVATNPNLPVAPSAMDGSGQFVVGLDGRKQEQESNVLLASIENMQYPVNVDVLYTVFSAFGPVQKIAMFEKNAGWHALIQYPDIQTATVAKESLEGHCIYDGGFCKLHISSSRHTDLSVKVNNDRSRDYTIPNSSMMSSQPSILGQQPVNAVGPTAASMYSGAPFAAGVDVNVMAAQPVAAWGVNPAAMSQTMGPPMLGTSYMIPGTASPEMAPGMMHLHGHSVPPHVRPMPPYGH